MCDCFHLAFPNWHASATGNGHRLRGPEQGTEEDLVCEEPEVLEEERPRPQGSSPVEEFPATEKYVKQAEGDFYDSPTKSSKKGKKGFGSMFDKRSSGKMNKNEESEMIVKTVKGGCAEGLVVSGGGKDGIFIKEVKKESPASKHLSVKEGDQILSATVYFDNVSYEDALQILEHAQPYKVEFCLKRKPAPTRTQEDAETTRPGVTIGEEAGEEDDTGPEMRGRRKSKKQHDRISWPKFPSFTKGHGAKFKRSHSTSEAEEQRKLEMSPTTSDTESPLKSPLKSLDDKDKKKMHKKKLKMRMTGRRSKSVEETPENAEETDDVEVLNNQNIMNIDEEHSFHESVTNLVEIPNMLDEADKTESIKTRNEFTYPTLPVTESLHKAELITLDNTLKTTDITAAFGEEKREISELKVSIQGKDKSEIGTDTQLKSFSSGMGTSDPSTMISVVASPNLLSKDEIVGHQVDSDIKLENKEILEKTHELEETDMNVPKTDVEKSQMTGSDKGKKEINILEREIYGIRTRGPLADIAISSHFAPNRFDFTSSDPFAFEIKRVTDTQKQSTSRPVISQPKPNALESQRANTDAILGDLGKTSKFELPKVDMSQFEHQETITIKQRDTTKVPVLNREEIEIPGREDKRSKENYQSPKIKETKVEKIIKISKTGHTKRAPEEFNVDDVKEAVSKFPSFKLPERDITGVLVQREVAMMEMKTGLTPKGSPCKISSISTEKAYVSPEQPETVKEVNQKSSSIVTKDKVNILPQPELYLHDETDINENKTGRSKKAQQSKTGKMLSRDGKISTSPDAKLPKREDIEIPGMEANEQKIKADTQDKAVKDFTDVTEKSNIKPVRKGHEKKSKKAKVSIPSFEIAKPDIRIPDIRIELPKKATSSKSDDMKEKMHLDETKQMIESDQMQHWEASTATVTKVPTQDITQDLRASDNKEMNITEAEITGKDTNKEWGKIKMPSIDLSLPKVKLTLTEGKAKHKDTGLTKPETDASVEFSKEQKSSESAALTKESVKDVDKKVEDVEDVQDGTGLIEIDGKTEVEPKAEMKETEAKIKKRKISFPKFGFSKSDSKVSDAEKSHPTAEGSLKEGDADVTEKDVEYKTKEVEADIKDSTDSPSRFRLPTIKFPKIGVSFSKTSDGQTDIQMPDASTEETTALPDIKSPEIIISVSKPELSLPEGKTEITSITIPKVDVESEGKKEMKISSELSFSKPEVGLTDHEVDGEVIAVELSKPDIKAVATDGSLPQGDFSIQEGKMEIKEPNVSFTVSEDEAEQKDPTVGSTQTKFKLPSINLPKIGGKTSKVVKDMPMIDIDAEEPDVRLPEAEISMELKDDAPLGDIKEPHVTTEGYDEGHSVDMKAEDVKPKKQEGTFKLPKIGFSKSDVPASDADLSLPKIDASKLAGSTDYEESIKETAESNAEPEQDEEILKGSPTKFKLPTIKFPKIGVSLTKTAAADHDNQMPEVTKDKPTMGIKLPEAELAGDLPSLPEMERSNIILSLSEEKTENAHYEIKTLSPDLAISKPEIKMGLVDHGSAKEPAIEDSVVDTEVKLTSVREDADIPEAKDKEIETKIKKHKISFPKFGFSKAEAKHLDVDTNVKTERKHVPETETKDTEEAVPAPDLEVQLKNKGTTGSPSKFKLPTISLPKFDISISKTEEESHGKADDVEKSERKATSAVLSQQKDLEISKDTETQDKEPSKLHFEALPGDAEIKDKETDPQSHGSRFMTTKFEFSFPKLKRPESKKGAPKMVDNVEKPEGTHDIEMESQHVDGKADVNLEYELSKPDIEAPEVNVTKEDVAMTTGEVDVKQLEPDIKTHTKTKRGSPIKFKVPSFKLPKFGSSASKVKPEVTDVTGEADLLEAEVLLTSVDISDGKIDLTVSDFEQPTVDTADISLPDTKSGKPEFEYEVPQESDSMGMKTKQTDISLPKLQKPDISTPEGSVDPAETNKDVKVSQMESGQKDSIFGSPTKFKLPSISFPKFGGKSQKVAVDTKASESEIEATNTKIDSSQLEADFEVHPSNIEIEDTKRSADVPVVDSKGLEVKKKRTGFSFPKFGFSKPEITPPELDVTVQKTDVSIPESIVHVSDQTAEITLPTVGMEAEQKDLTIVGSPPKFEMPSVNLPTFEIKTSKDTVHLSSEINVPVSEIKMSAQIPTTDPAIREKEDDMFATGGKVVIPSADTDIQYISIEGKADIPVADSKDLDVKLKKPSFSLPKLGFSKPDIKEQEADLSQPRIDVSLVEGNIPVIKQDAEMIPDEENKQDATSVSQTKFKMPSINLPKFGIKYSKETNDIPTADVDIKEPEISFPETVEMETIDTKTNVDINMPSVNVNIKTKGADIDDPEIKFKLPKFGIGMQKVKESETEHKETETGPLSVNEVKEPEGAIQDETIKREADNVEMDSKGIKVKLPKIGFSKQELKSPEVDISLPKVDMDISMGIADSQQSADIASPEKDLKDDALIGSPTKFKLPTFNFPKFGIKSSRSTIKSPTVNVDAGPEVSLPEENIKISSEVPTFDIKEPIVEVEDISTEINIKGKNIDKEQKEGKFKLPKFGIGLPKMKGPESKTLTDSEEKGDLSADIKELMLSSEAVEVDKEAKSTELDIEESQLKLPKLKSPEIDINISKVEVSHTDTREATPLNAEDLVVEEPSGLSSKEVTIKIKKPSFAFPKIGFSKSDGKAQDIQASETTADMSFPEGSVKIEDSDQDIKSPEGETEVTSPQFGSPTKFKLPTIKLPKFGLSASTKVSKGEEVETQKMDPLDDKTGATDSTSVDTNIKANLDNQDGQDIKFKLPKFEISLPKVKGPEVEVATKELKTEAPEVVMSKSDTSVPKADTDIQQGSVSIQKTEGEAELKDDKAVTGSPSKFKLPSFKMPKFGISTQKSSDVKTEVTEADEPNIKTDLNVDNKPIVSKDIHIEGEIKETTEQGPEAGVKKKDSDKGSPSKFKLPSIKMPKINFSRTKSQEEDDTTVKASAPEIKIELKEDLQGPEKSPTFTRPTHGDGFEVEFNVPTLEEMETQKDRPSETKDSEPETKVEESIEHKDKSKFKFKFPKLGFSHSLDESDKLDDTKVDESAKHDEAPVDQKVEDNKEHSKAKKGGWFKFSSPTKTAKVNKNETVQTPEDAEKRPINEDVEKETNKVNEEPEKSPMSEIVEENISPTLSIRSSEAFADISSALNTEQIGMSQSSPTKVKVKYAEPAAAVGVNDTHVQSDVVTSTARCELISMEPHQPEKVNIPFSSDMSSTSVDTLKQMSGEIHVITSNIQAIPETQQAAILTSLDAQGIHTSPLEVTLTSDSVLTVEETRVQSAKHTLVEKHVVKETSSDDKSTIIVTRTTHVFEGDSAEPISDETASSIRRLRDTVHIEKMRFFDSVATTEEVQVTSSEISLRHMDSSTEENGEK